MRLFVALLPPPPVLNELDVAVAPLRSGEASWVWTRPTQWHLTLAFLGEVDDPVPAEVTRRLQRVAARHPPLRLAVRGGGRFGHRVLWAGVAGDREPLRRLAASVRTAARRAGAVGPAQAGGYRPHLTLARTHSGADLRVGVAALSGFAGTAWSADTLHLMHSRLGAGPGGTAAHDTVASWPLRPRRSS